MNRPFKSQKFKSLFPFFLLAVAIIVSFKVISELQFFIDVIGRIGRVLAPFFYGFLIAYIVNIPIGAIERLFLKSNVRFIQKRSRLFGALIVVIIILSLLVLLISIVVPALISSITIFIENFPAYIDNIVAVMYTFNEVNPFGWNISTEGIIEMLGNMFSEITIDSIIGPINALLSAASAAFTGVIALISSVYILAGKDKIKGAAHRLLKVVMSNRVYVTTVDHFSKLNKNFRTYIRTQTIDGMILGTLATIPLLIIGSPFALILGIMLGVVNYVPYFGSIIGTLITVLVVMFTQDFVTGLIIAGVLFVIQQFDANFIQPRLMSGSFSLSPLFVIIAITAGGAVGGVMGMIVAIPIAAVLKDIYDSIVTYYEQKKLAVPAEPIDDQIDSEVQSDD